jgi:hypothetical protein
MLPNLMMPAAVCDSAVDRALAIFLASTFLGLSGKESKISGIVDALRKKLFYFFS